MVHQAAASVWILFQRWSKSLLPDYDEINAQMTREIVGVVCVATTAAGSHRVSGMRTRLHGCPRTMMALARQKLGGHTKAHQVPGQGL